MTEEVIKEKSPKRGRPYDETKEEIMSNGLTKSQWEAVKFEAHRRRPQVTAVQVLRESVEHYLDSLAKERGGTESDERLQ